MYRRLSYLALALVVVVLGAYVPLADAGLGCPDWPGCYGHLTVASAQANATQVNALYPDQPLEAGKALKEMVHRYAAGTLGLLGLMLVVIGWWRKHHQMLLTLLGGLILFQAALGMWTITMQLKPLVVTAHLIGEMTVLAMLWRILLDNRYREPLSAGAWPCSLPCWHWRSRQAQSHRDSPWSSASCWGRRLLSVSAMSSSGCPCRWRTSTPRSRRLCCWQSSRSSTTSIIR